MNHFYGTDSKLHIVDSNSFEEAVHDLAAYLVAYALSQAMDFAGLSACSIQWGAWGGVGMVAHNATVLQRMHRAGIEVVKPSSGLGVLAKVLFGSSISPQV